TGATACRRADPASFDSPRAAWTDHLSREVDCALRPREPAEKNGLDGRAPARGEARVLPELRRLSRRPARRPGALRPRLQPHPGARSGDEGGRWAMNGARFFASLRMTGSLVLAAPLIAQQPQGKAVYDKWCSGCHGETGAGDGFGARTMLPQPRDFTKGVYKIRTTASGEIPTDADIRHIVEVGMPGTAMPEWKSRLSDGEIGAVVQYIKSFSTFFKGTEAKPMSVGSAPGGSGADEGRKTFEKLECFKCHGQGGRGDGKSAPTLKDDYGHPIRAADLTESWKFRGGNTVDQIYTRLRTGLDGTPMPSFQEAIENKLISDEQLWRLAQYVRSLSPEKP